MEGAAEEVREREVAAAKKEAEVAAALEEVSQRETAAQAAAAQLARLDKQLGARKLEARELQVTQLFTSASFLLLVVPCQHMSSDGSGYFLSIS